MKRKILIRFDDLCPTMDHALWKEASSICNRYGVKPLVGVIPDCVDPDLAINTPDANFWEMIRNLQKEGYTVAMHGLHHQYTTKNRGIVGIGHRSEFAGLPYQSQLKMIQEGKEILNSHGIITDVFFAPSHTYDKNTIKALSACGFKYISDGKSCRPYMIYGIKCFPCKSSSIPKLHKSGNYTAIFHAHEWSRPGKTKGMENLEYLCKEYHEDIVTFSDYIDSSFGNYVVQRLCETMYVLYQRNVRPILVNIYVKYFLPRRKRDGIK